MANNRMMIKCQVCGSEVVIGKTMDDITFYPAYGIHLTEILEYWFEKHSHPESLPGFSSTHYMLTFEKPLQKG